jgi:uncharacterized membrane protein
MMSKSDSSTTAVHVIDKTLMLSQQYNKYVNVFSEENVDKLLSHQDHDHIIKIKKHKLFYDSLYNLLKTELQVLKEYLDNILTKK